MTFTLSGGNQKSCHVFSEEALRHILKKKLPRGELANTETFYNRARHAGDLNKILNELKKHLGIRSPKIRAVFSNQISVPGYCAITKERSIIYVNSSFTGDAPACAAIIAHNLCHFELIQLHKVIFEETSENEKAADLWAILRGLGLVVLGGAVGVGWKSLPFVKRFDSNRRKIIGYYSLKSFAQKTSQYFLELHMSPYEVAKNCPAWSNKLLDHELRYKGPPKTQFMKSTYSRHTGSIRNFWLCVAVVSLSVLVFIYILQQKPVFLNEEIQLRKEKLTELENSYNACVKRVQHKEKANVNNDPQISRHIDSERNECKSLRNRYNYEVDIYNQLRARYKR